MGVAIGLGLALPATAWGHGGGSYVSAPTNTPPTLDGVVTGPEWSGAPVYTVTLSSATGIRSATVRFVHTATDLYVGAVVQDTLAVSASFDVYFDNTHNGLKDPGDDAWLQFPGLSQDFFFDPAASGGQGSHVNDLNNAGTVETTGATAASGGAVTFEIKHPLCSNDVAHDICARARADLGVDFGYDPGTTPATFFTGPGVDTLDPSLNWADLSIGDITAPSVTITNPAPGLLSGNVNVTADATDDVGVDHVTFEYYDPLATTGPHFYTLGTDSSPPYSATFDTTRFPDRPSGAATVYAQAFDTAGNASKVGIGVGINNGTSPSLGSVHGALDVEIVFLQNFWPNTSVAMNVGGTAFTATTDAAGDAAIPSPVNLVPGVVVTGDDGRGQKTLTLESISITGINTTTDVATGTAPPDRTVGVVLFDLSGNVIANVTTPSDAAGAWSTQIAGADAGMYVYADVADADGDRSRADFPIPPLQSGSTFTVNSAGDGSDGCTTDDCTLREAILAANAAAGPNTIAFAIPGGGTQTIVPLTPLPALTDRVTIDGYTQPGATPNTLAVGDNAVLRVVLSGAAFAGVSAPPVAALDVETSGAIVRGLVINGGFEYGVAIGSGTGNIVAGNFVGTDPTGTSAVGVDQYGVSVTGGASGNTIGGATPDARNVLSGTTGISFGGGAGVAIALGAANNDVVGNLIGTTASGRQPLPNGTGIIVLSGAHDNRVTGNVASGNVRWGIEIQQGGSTGNVVAANFVGTDTAGAAALGNGFDGIRIDTANGNTVGGTTVGARNVVGGNSGHGIFVFNSTGNVVQGNYSGLDATGSYALANDIDGIAVDGGGGGNTIGGTAPGAGNLSSGNRNQGISIFQVGSAAAATGNIVQGNFAGMNAAGTAAVPNQGNGIRMCGASNTTVGVPTGSAGPDGAGNTVWGNGSDGIAVYRDGSCFGAAATQNTIRRNSVHDNGGLGIALYGEANNSQAAPVLTAATVTATGERITGTMRGLANTPYTIDYYASDSCDAGGAGEGARWLGWSLVSTDANGLAQIDTQAGLTAPITAGDAVTATSTNASGSTSQFSTCVTASETTVEVGLSLTADELAVPAGAGDVPLSRVPASTFGLFAGAPIPNSPIPNSPVGAAPIPNSPIPNSPIPNSPIPNSPIPNSPIPNSGLDGIPASLLENVQLSSIPIDWAPIFAGTTRAGLPPATLTLRDVFADQTAKARFDALTLGRLHLEDSLLRGVRFVSVLLGGTRLRYIPPYTQAAWCAKFQSCAGIDVTTTTVLGLDVAGLLPAAGLGNVTIGQITDPGPPTVPIPNSPIPNSPIPNSPIPNSPIPNSPIPNSPIPNSAFTLTTIGSIVVGSLADYRPVVDCTKLTTCQTRTLADAQAAGAILSTARYVDLLLPNPTTGRSPMADVKLSELVIALIGLDNMPWESWPIDGFQEFAGTGDVVHYHLTASVPCGSPYQLRAVLPVGFLVKRGTSALAVGNATAAPVADPATDSRLGATWSLPAITCPGTQSVRLDFSGLAGFRLGRQSGAAKLIVGGAITTAPGQAPVTVQQNSEPDDNAATAPSVAPGHIAIGHVATSGDLDWRRLALPSTGRGTRILVYLRPPAGTDLDLYLEKPGAPTLLSSPIPNSPIPNSPIPNSPLPDNGGTLNQTAQNLQPEGLQDAPIPNSEIAAAGITRGDGVEVAQVELAGGEVGDVKIVVDGYNGAHSDDAYTLRVKVIPPPNPPACNPRSFRFSTGVVGTLPVGVASGTKTLFLVNRGATFNTFDTTAASQMMSKLALVAGRSEVKGQILEVDGDADVRAAKSAWDASPCSVDKANAVVRAINAVVARYRTSLSALENIVIVGGDELMPMARVPDLTTDANESTAVGDLQFTAANGANATYASLYFGNVLTDDAYFASTTIPWFGRELYLPQVAGGRLVETADEISGQLDQYVASGGTLNPASALVTGYDFMADEAAAVRDSLAARPNLTVDATASAGTIPFVGDLWTKTDVERYFGVLPAVQRDVLSVNGHYNHWELAPASPTPLTTATLVPTSVLPAFGATAPQFPSSLLFTIGCHAGLSVSDTFPSGPTPERLRDWAQALAQNRAAAYVANTGYGYGDYKTIALSERLLAIFASNLRANGSIGRKFVAAKQEYFNSIATYDPYAEKALTEATFYGLPFYRLGTGETQAPAPVVPIADSGNVQKASFTFDPVLTPKVDAARGTVFLPPDGAVEYAKDRPIEPRLSKDVTAGAGLRAHGVRINALTTHDAGDFDPVIATPTIDLGAREPEHRAASLAFPASFVSLNRSTLLGTPRDTVVLVAGQSRPAAGAKETQRLVDHIAMDVLYSTSSDFEPPVFTQVGSVVANGVATLFARTSDAGSAGVVVQAFFTEGSNVWRFVPLQRVGTSDLYTATANVSSTEIQAAFLSQDGAGNVAYTTGKGFLYLSKAGDTEAPQVRIDTPLDGGVFQLSQPVKASYSCSDDGGVAQCAGPVGNGGTVDTSTGGVHTFAVEAKDVVGNTITKTATYTVQYAFGGFFDPVDNLPTVNTAKAGSAFPVKFALGYNAGLGILAGAPTVTKVVCAASAALDAIEQTVSSDTSKLVYDATANQYAYIWKTLTSYAGNCYRLTLTLNDGTSHQALFKFSK